MRPDGSLSLASISSPQFKGHANKACELLEAIGVWSMPCSCTEGFEMGMFAMCGGRLHQSAVVTVKGNRSQATVGGEGVRAVWGGAAGGLDPPGQET